MTASTRTCLRHAVPFAAAVALVLGSASGARAEGFEFFPLVVDLTAAEHVGSITLRNPGDVPLRLEAQAYRWTQRADGRPALDPSNDLIVFPQLLTVPPHDQRNIRVATTDPPAALESTFKVSITEIGSFSAPATRGAGIALQLRTDVPVFVAPAVERRAGAIAAAGVRDRTVSFAVVNSGTLHFVAKDVRVTGFGADARPLFSTQLESGEVLAGAKREYRLDVSRQQCGALRAVSMTLEAGDQQLTHMLEVPAGSCGV